MQRLADAAPAEGRSDGVVEEQEGPPRPFQRRLWINLAIQPLPPLRVGRDGKTIRETDQFVRQHRRSKAKRWIVKQACQTLPMELRLVLAPEERRRGEDLVVHLADRVDQHSAMRGIRQRDRNVVHAASL